MLERVKRLLGAEPDLTWLESDSPQLQVPAEPPFVEVPARRRRLEINVPLAIGGVIVLLLFGLVLFGPLLAPEDPYLAGQRSSMIIDGQFTTPPFPPMPGLPLGTDEWGRDILSMLLYGTRNTLVACLFIAMARIIFGAALGMLAGWSEGGLLDRLVMSLIEFTTALPGLLAGMILILALGVERGIGVFIVGLCLIGWGEIAQYIRSEFILVRRKPFIEGARVIGLSDLEIAVRHVLPNVLPSLVVIAVLEMGAVLMMLGELGFIGIFVGGGTWVQVGDTAVANIPDVPEWGAMMAGARQFARSKTWMVFYPAAAFFVAVLGFNLLGEGLSRLIRRRGVKTSFLLSKRMVLVILAVAITTAYIVTHVGPAPSYAGLAQRFDSGGALTVVNALAGPEMQGRAPGSTGARSAAEYVGQRFAEYGLEPLKAGMDYVVPLTTTLAFPLNEPSFEVLGLDGEPLRTLTYRDDFGLDITGHGGEGTVTGQLAWLGVCGQGLTSADFRGLDLRNRVVVFEAASVPQDMVVESLLRGAVAVVLVDDDIDSRLQYASAQGDYSVRPTLPVIRLRKDVASQLLSSGGLSMETLAAKVQTRCGGRHPWELTDLGLTANIRLTLSQPEVVQAVSLIGVLRGTDAQLNKQVVMVSMSMDGGGSTADGRLLQRANAGLAPIGTVLEILRLWHTQGFRPRRTMMFAAWAGAEWQYSGAHAYLDEYARYSILETAAVVNLGGLGGGSATLLAQGDDTLVDLFQRCAEAGGAQAGTAELLWHPYEVALGTPALKIEREGARVPVADDVVTALDPTLLGQAGHALNLMLITLSREYEY